MHGRPPGTGRQVTRYFSTILHGNELDVDKFQRETDEIVQHPQEQEAIAGD